MTLEIWDKLKTPPDWALKRIEAGRLKGKLDIKPQWRYQAMTEVFGQVGIGWKFEVVKLWTEPGTSGQVFAFAQINLFVKNGQEWSDSIPGVGGSMLIEQETKGLHCNNEGFKMAITDALGTAMKMLGVAALVYQGKFESKYEKKQTTTDPQRPCQDVATQPNKLDPQINDISTICKILSVDQKKYNNKTYYVIKFNSPDGDDVCSTWSKSEADAVKLLVGMEVILKYEQKGKYKNFIAVEDQKG